MSRIYTEIRITHKSADEKKEFENKLTEQANKLGFKAWADYIRLIVSLDISTGIINKLREP